MKRITVIVKPTLFCNVNCRHCCVEKKEIKVEDPEFYVKAMRCIFDFHRSFFGKEPEEVEVIWHGGEPLLMGRKFYIEVYKHLNNVFPDKIFKHGIQTNLLFYDRSWNDVFKEIFEWRVGTSYDFFSSFRRYSFDTLWEKLSMFQDASGEAGFVICVLSKENVKRVNEIVFLALEKEFCLKLNVLYEVGKGKELSYLVLDPYEYAEALISGWKVFKDGGGFRKELRLEPIIFFEEFKKGKRDRLPCNITSSCAGKIYAVFPDGNIFPCAELGDLGVFRLGDINSGIDRRRFVDFLQAGFVFAEECSLCGICGGGCVKQRFLHLLKSGRSVQECKESVNFTKTPFCVVWRKLFNEVAVLK